MARLLSTVGLDFSPANTSTTVQGHNINGIFIQEEAHLQINGAALIQGNGSGRTNSGDGVHIQQISIGDFTPIPGSGSSNNTTTGNGGSSVFCDVRSLVIGSLAGLSNVKCGENDQQ